MEQVNNTSAWDIAALITKVWGIVSKILSLVQTPIGVVVSTAVWGLIAWAAYKFILAKINKKAKEAAKIDTDKGHQEQIENRLPTNAENNKKDNENRSKLDLLD